MAKRRRRIWPWIAAFAVLVAVAALAFDSNWLKGPLERAISERSGRAFEIRGDFDIDLALHPRFRMYGVRFENPPWAREPEMLRIEHAYFSVALLPLLRGQLVLPEVALNRPMIDLERDAQGRNNWTLSREPRDPAQGGAPPVIGRLTVDQGLLLFSDVPQDTALALEVENRPAAQGRDAGLAIRARGRLQGQRLDAEGGGGGMLSLADATLAYPLSLRFQVGKTQGAVEGTITGLTAFAAADLRLQLAGETLAELFPLLQVALPPTPPYRIEGRLIRAPPSWRFHDFSGRVGDSDLSGDVDITYGNERTQVQAQLESERVDLDDLGAILGVAPEAGPGETASAKQAREAAEQAAAPTLLPDVPIRLDRLRAMDAQVAYRGKSIRGRTPVEDLATRVTLKDGVLTLKPLNFGVAGGAVVSTLVLDGRQQRAGVDADVEFRRIDLRKLFPGNARVQKSAGLLGGRAVLKGDGNSLAEVLAASDGTVGLAMSGGRVSNLVLELAGLDFGEALRLLFRGDKTVALRCAVADLEVHDGVVRSRSTIIDTTDTHIKVDGTIDLGGEQLDLTLHPLPKDYSLLTLRTPIHVQGTFKDPEIQLDDELLVRGGIAAILGSVAAPIAALAALVESGPGDDANCEHLIAAVERHVRKDLPEADSP